MPHSQSYCVVAAAQSCGLIRHEFVVPVSSLLISMATGSCHNPRRYTHTHDMCVFINSNWLLYEPRFFHTTNAGDGTDGSVFGLQNQQVCLFIHVYTCLVRQTGVRQPSLFLAHSGEISLEGSDEIFVQFYLGWRNLHMQASKVKRLKLQPF